MPLAFETYTCGECGKPVETEWCSDGLLPGPYALLGEVFFHAPECSGKFIESFEKACCTADTAGSATLKPTYEMLEARVALLKECHDASNEALRSAMEIAKRDGKDTNWEGHRAQLQHALEVHHAAMANFRS